MLPPFISLHLPLERANQDISIQSPCQRFNLVQFILLEIRLLLYLYGDESKLETEKLEEPCGCQTHDNRHLSENNVFTLFLIPPKDWRVTTCRSPARPISHSWQIPMEKVTVFPLSAAPLQSKFILFSLTGVKALILLTWLELDQG